MRRLLLRSLALSAAIAGAAAPRIAQAETLAQCQAWGAAIPPASAAICRDLYTAAIEARPTRTMYEVDPNGLPTRLHSTTSDLWTPGAYDEFDKGHVRERSTDGTYRTRDGLSVRIDSKAYFESAYPWLATIGAPIGGLTNIGTTSTSLTSVSPFLVSPIVAFPIALTDGLTIPSEGLPLSYVDELTFKAHPAWETRKDSFNSCQEYVWKLYYEHSRFVDSARVCGNDDECIGDVAYAPTRPPAIAYGDIHDINGAKSPGQLRLMTGGPSKNLFFATSPWYLRDQHDALVTALANYERDENQVRGSGGCAFMKPGPYAVCSDYVTLTGPEHQNDGEAERAATRAKMTAIDGLLRKKLFYSVGSSWITPLLKMFGSTELEKFPSEWDFHAAMRSRVTAEGVPPHERKAIEERTAYLEKLVSAYVEATSLRACRQPPMAQGPNDGGLLEGFGPSIIDVIGNGSPDPWVERWAIGALSTGIVSQGSTLASPIGIIDGAGTRLDVPSLVGKNAALLPGGFKSIPAGQFMAAVKSNRTKTALAPVNVIVDGKTQQQQLMSSDISFPGAGNLKVGGIGVLPPGLTKLTPVATCDADVSKAGATLSRRLSAVYANATAIQQEIADLLVHEYDRGDEGCLSEKSYRCDWSPALLAARFVEQLATEKQSALDECLSYTGGGNLAEATAAGQNKVSRFQEYVTAQKAKDEAALAELPSIKTTTGKIVAGEADHGDFQRGDDEWFGAGYSYDVDWSFDPIHSLGGGDNPAACGLLVDAHARFEAHASILGPMLDQLCPDGVPAWTSEIAGTILSAYGAGAVIAMCELHKSLKYLVDVQAMVTTNADASTDETRGQFKGNVVVANERLFSVDESFAVPTVQEGETVLFKIDGVVGPPPIETTRASVTVVVVVVPVTFQAWGELHLGAQIHGKAYQKVACSSGPASFSMKANLGFTPFVKATARASAAIGVDGLQAGVRGSVVLVDARLPLEASLAGGIDGTGASLQPSFDASVNASFLGGSLSAFAEVGYKPFRVTAEREIFSFDGFNRGLHLWSYKPAPINVSALSTKSWDKWQSGRASGGSP